LLRAAIIKQLLTNEISFGLIKVQFGKEIFTRYKIAPSGSTIPKPNGKEFAFIPVCQTILTILAFGIWYLDFGFWYLVFPPSPVTPDPPNYLIPAFFLISLGTASL
jgi:hypothetical protein